MQNPIAELFKDLVPDAEKLERLRAMPDPALRYLIGFTARSVSSYLCDLLSKDGRFGQPDEMINPAFIPKIFRTIPGSTPDEYLAHVFRCRGSRSGASGIKANWPQFERFVRAMLSARTVLSFRYIYLTRRDTAAQAVSLYKANASSVFHTNKSHSAEALERLSHLTYDFDSIDLCHHWTLLDEAAWQRFFDQYRITPLVISYEQIHDNVAEVLHLIAAYLGLDSGTAMAPAESVFKRVSDDRNREWAMRFAEEKAAGAGRPAPPGRKMLAENFPVKTTAAQTP